MKYTELFDACYHSNSSENPHDFIAGVRYVINHLAQIPIDEVTDEIAEFYEELKEEEELKKWEIKKMDSVPNKCESCDRFDQCYVLGAGRLRGFCRIHHDNIVFKFRN